MAKKRQHRQHLDVAKLKCPNTNRDFGTELRKRFSAFADYTDHTEDPDLDINNKWETIKKVYVETATKVLGYRKNNNKEWLTPGTWQKIEVRKQLKAKLLGAKSPRLPERAQKAKDRQVKKSAKSDKRAFVEDLAKKVEQAAARGEMNAVYNITKKLSGKYTSQLTPVKDKDGNILRTEHEQTARWAQHFREVLNCPEPDDPANPPLAEDVHNIDTSPPTHEEVKCAIQAMKGGKAAGIDAIHTEMLKADLTTSTKGAHRTLQIHLGKGDNT